MQKFLRVRIDLGNIIITLRRIPKVLTQGVMDEAMKAATQVQSDMQIPGMRVHYPIHWTSNRQRRAFFASNGFGGGIPTQRTGGYQKGWQVIQNPSGVYVGHPWVGAVFLSGNVRGQGQSSIHKGRWPLFKDAINRALARFKNTVMTELDKGLGVVIRTNKQ